MKEKQEFFYIFMHALQRASYNFGCVAYSHHRSKMPQIHLQMIQAAAKCDLVRNVVSVKGAPKMSRLLPMPELEKEFSKDPWEFDADRMKTFVLLTKRHSLNEEIPCDLNDPIPAEIQQKLEQINKVNSSVEIITVRLEVE